MNIKVYLYNNTLLFTDVGIDEERYNGRTTLIILELGTQNIIGKFYNCFGFVIDKRKED